MTNKRKNEDRSYLVHREFQNWTNRRITEEEYNEIHVYAADLREHGFGAEADKVLSEVRDLMNKNPVGRPTGPIESDNRKEAPRWRLAWRVTVKVDDILRPLGKARKGEADDRFNSAYAKALEDLGIKTEPDWLKEGVRDRSGRKADIEQWRQRFKDETKATTPTSIT